MKEEWMNRKTFLWDCCVLTDIVFMGWQLLKSEMNFFSDEHQCKTLLSNIFQAFHPFSL